MDKHLNRIGMNLVLRNFLHRSVIYRMILSRNRLLSAPLGEPMGLTNGFSTATFLPTESRQTFRDFPPSMDGRVRKCFDTIYATCYFLYCWSQHSFHWRALMLCNRSFYGHYLVNIRWNRSLRKHFHPKNA